MNYGWVMKETLTIPLSELKTVRLVCQRANCGGVAEMPTTRLDGLTGEVACPSCNLPFSPKVIGDIRAFKALGLTLKSLAAETNFAVEFVAPRCISGDSPAKQQ